MSAHDDDEERKLTQRLQKLEREMQELDDRDELLLQKAYENPQEADDRMFEHRNRYGEHDLYVALRERPEIFGDYPQDKARFDDAFQARKQLPDTFGEYMKRRDESDEIQRSLNRIRREKGDPSPDDDFTPKR